MLDGSADRECGLFIQTNDDNARVRIVLGLRDDFTGDCAHVATCITKHQQLAGAGWRVDSNISAHLKLRLGDISVPWSDDPVDARNALGAVGHRRDRAGAAQREDAIHRGDFTRGEHDRRGVTVSLRRRAEKNLGNTGDTRGNSTHQHAARVRGATARRVDADALQRIGASPDNDARLGLDSQRARRISGVNHLDVPRCALESSSQRSIDSRERTEPRRSRYLEGIERHSVVCTSHLTQRTVTVEAYTTHYFLRLFAHQCAACTVSAQERSPLTS